MIEPIAAVVAIAALGACAQALTGFGFALVAVPLLALVLGAEQAVAVATVVGLAMAAVVSVRRRREVRWAAACSVTVAAVAGMPLGLLLFAAVREPVLALVIATVVLVFAGITVLGLAIPRSTASAAVAGMVGGVFLTSCGMNGPPVVAGLQAMGFDPRELRATLQATFAVQDSFAVAGFALTGILTAQSWILAGAALPGVLAGWLAGSAVFTRLPVARFRGLVVCLLVLSAAVLLARSAADW